ncbi:MAG: NIPSNAP family protein [Albimonas sp.]|uniref:NIPSNAP family protein n=1 Tax=Albimonas sp. TaxID=1872425 RepID=UPI0040568B20|tara:strand:- start:279 stop:1001 length:723 start_codon:yes stop_codon:yes gene_type:complete
MTPTVFELRRYRLRPGAREPMIDLFDREFVETQEACGMAILGQFRELGDPDAFVWMRGFADRAARRSALERFYGGPVWAEHAPAARATMVNTADALLLRPAAGGPLAPPPGPRAAPGAAAPAAGLLRCTTWHPVPGREAEVAALHRDRIAPLLAQGPGRLLAAWERDPAPNDFAPLPVRPDPVFVTLEAFADAPELALTEGLEGGELWREEIGPQLDRLCWRPARRLILAPTARSAWRGV